MTIQELKIEAKAKKKEGNFEDALELYKKLWSQEKNEWNGYFLAQCYRKTENYTDARKIHLELENLYPNFKPIQNDKLWLDYSEKIKNWKNPDLVSDAEYLLSRSDKYDKYTGTVYTKTVLNVVKHFSFEQDYKSAYEWLLKLDQTVISNSVFDFQGQVYPADRKVYFIRFADVLINLDEHLNYIEQCLTNLNFSGIKHSKFKQFIIDDITFDEYLSRVKFAKHIKHFQEEFKIREQNNLRHSYNQNKTTLISDLSHYLFCPISFAINETFQIISNTSWEKDEWLGTRKLLIDRHNIFRRTKSFEESFKDSDIVISAELKSDFAYIYNSSIRVNNATNPKPTIYSNETNTLKGAPDYVLQDSNGIKFAITEKFSSIHSADSKTPFESDLIKHYAFIDELKKAQLSFGFFITWYWDLVNIETNNGNIKKKIVITSYRINKIIKTESNSKKLQNTINSVYSFKQSKSMQIEGDRISYASKCFKCSVFAYCNHKTGKFDLVKLPYDLSENQTANEPKIDFNDLDQTNDTIENDLPF